MTERPVFAWILATLLAGTACGSQGRSATPGSDSTELAARTARLAAAVAQPDTGAPIAQWLLPQQLSEISGLALTADGRILTHTDRRGKVYEIDYRRGVVVKEFALGTVPLKEDFESITVVGDTVIMMSSTGILYMFKEGANGSHVPFTVHNTGLGAQCEFEAMTFDPATHALLLACKVVKTPSLKGSLVIFRWALGSASGARGPALTVPIAQLTGSNGWDGLHPSDITIDPFNGNYVIIAGREKAIVEITPTGSVVFARPIPGDHVQPEGVAITRDSILIISDEAGQPSVKKKKGGGSKGAQLGAAAVTLYRWPLARVPQGAP